jgi:hypothetical protein
VLAVVEHPKLTLAIAAALLIASGLTAYFGLNISTDQNKLFSAKAKFFGDYLNYVHKFPETEAIYVLIERRDRGTPMPPVKRWTAAADAVAARVRGLGPEQVRDVESRVPVEKLGEQGLLFDKPERLPSRVDEVRRFIPLVHVVAQTPNVLTGAVLGRTPLDRLLSSFAAASADAEQGPFVGEIARSLTEVVSNPDAPLREGAGLPDLAGIGATTPEDLGYFWTPDETDKSNPLLLVRIYPKREFDSLTAISETVEAIRGAVATAAKGFDEFHFGVTGRPALEADEMSTTDRDSNLAEAIALAVVFVGLIVFLKSVWLAIAAEISLVVAIGWTFGWAEVSVGQLNLLSIVFLIALIGIGMDYLVQILVRYRQEARRHAGLSAVWARVFRHVGPPINTACLGAAGAFLVAVFTDFRGAAELGIIAGGGLLLCLLSGYTVLPALLTLVPGRFSRVYRERHRMRLEHGDDNHDNGTPTLPRRHVVPARAGGWRLLMPLGWATLLLLGVFIYAPRTGFNPNLIELQAQNLESVQLVRKLQTFSAAVLSKDLSVLRQCRDAVKDLPTVAGTDSLLVAYDNAAWLAANAKLPEIKWAEPASLGAGDVPRIVEKARTLAKKYADAAPKTQPSDRPSLQNAANALGAFALAAGMPEDQRAAVAARVSVWQRGFLGQL